VLVLTMFDDDASLFAALRAGARGYILKGADQADIARALVACAQGEAIFGPVVAARVLEYFTGAAPAAATPAFPELTEREREILERIASGANNARIAQQLGISVKTVRNHSSNIFTKLHVSDRAQAIVRARDEGLGDRRSS
jgi:DNA-binding NarL/FixJ family response regulator